MTIAENAGVVKEVILATYLGNPVKYSDAVDVLLAFSQHVGYYWLLEDLSVPTVPEERED